MFKRQTKIVFDSPAKSHSKNEVICPNSSTLTLHPKQSKGFGFPDKIVTNLAYDKY